MKKLLLFLFFLFCIEFGYTQVGINTTTPNAQLDIKSSNQATPSNTDGILIPKINAFPAINPTALQQGMMVYLTTTIGLKVPGFYYWDNATVSWLPVSKTDDDWYEVGSSSAPNNISDAMFHTGDVAIGKTTTGAKLDLEQTSSNTYAIRAKHTNPPNIFSSSVVDNEITSNQASGVITGVNNLVNANNSVIGYGIYNNMQGNTVDALTGVNNAFFSNGANIRTGFSNNFNSGTGQRIGLDNYFTGSGNTQRGVYNQFTGTPTQAMYGLVNSFNDLSNQVKSGVYNSFTNNAVTNGDNVGLYNLYDGVGNSNKFGVRNLFSGNGDGTFYGDYNTISAFGIGSLYASHSVLDGSGTGDKVGTSVVIYPSAGGNHYGIKSIVTKSTGYAGYFEGRVAIGSTSSNTYILPLLRGTANQIMQTDGIGNVTWQSPSTIIGNNAWSTTGNTGTSPGTNFIGTTDDIDFVFKRKNLNSGIIGKFSTAFGDQALASLTTGTHNVAFGSFAMNSNTTGISNTGLGKNALESNTVGSENTAVGREALVYNIRSNHNVAVGRSSLASNTSGNNNVAVGSGALLIQDFDNVGVAYNTNNVAVGFESMYNNNPTTNANGINNTAVGAYSLRTNIVGSRNVAVGINALYSNTNGNFNTAIGSYSYGSGSFTNSVAIGDASSITASNQVRIGDGGVTSIGGFANWTNVSDKRFKKDIQQNVPGLEFIKKLQPVTYHLDMDAIARLMKTPDELRKKESEVQKGKLLQTGFIAQDVEVAAKELGFDFSGVDAPKNESDFYGLRYAEFVVPLVKAVQEQQEIIDNQNTKILLLEERLKAIEEKLSK